MQGDGGDFGVEPSPRRGESVVWLVGTTETIADKLKCERGIHTIEDLFMDC